MRNGAKGRQGRLSCGVAVAVLLGAGSARAATDVTAPPGGGLGALGVHVDLAGSQVRFRTCPAAPCAPDAASEGVRITLPREQIPDAKDVVVEAVPIGQGRSVVHVRVPSQGSLVVAWEAVLAAGAPPLFADRTGFVRGEEGERSGALMQILGDDPKRFVLVGETREDLRICGQAMTMLAPAGLEASTLLFRGASVQRLPVEQRESAEKIVASPHGGPAEPPLAPLLVAVGASSEVGSFKALTDGDPKTTWAEARPGLGQGEFVAMSAPEEIPIARVSVVFAPPLPPGHSTASTAEGTAPKSFFLVTGKRTFAVTVPEDGWAHPGAAYDVAFPEPVKTSCLALVLDDAAYDRGGTHPQVTFAELYAYSAFDAPGATLGAVAKALEGGGARAEAAAGVLERAGPPGFAAMAAVYDTLDAPGRALAVHVAASAKSCDVTAPLLIRAMSDADREVRRKGRQKLENPVCGRAAVPEMVKALGEVTLRAAVAPLLASLAPAEALEPLAKAMEGGDAKVRGAVRSAFARAADRGPLAKVASLLGDGQRSAEPRVELLRAAIAKLPEARREADSAIDDLFRAAPPMRTRYLLAEPIAALAHAGDPAAVARLRDLVAKDADSAVRAHATEVAAGTGAADQAILLAILHEPEPRVREAALHAVASARLAQASADAARALATDRWTYVRTAAAGALAVLPASRDVDDALADALRDASPRVRAASVAALATRGAVKMAPPIRARLDDDREDIDVRLAAARALGSLCDAGSLERLTVLARRGADALADEATTQLALAATEALGGLHPADLATRLLPLRAKGTRNETQQAAVHALAEPARCH